VTNSDVHEMTCNNLKHFLFIGHHSKPSFFSTFNYHFSPRSWLLCLRWWCLAKFLNIEQVFASRRKNIFEYCNLQNSKICNQIVRIEPLKITIVKLSKLNLLWIIFCVRYRQVFSLVDFLHFGLYLKLVYTGVCFIQGSV
jgi:hypothetical protein